MVTTTFSRFIAVSIFCSLTGTLAQSNASVINGCQADCAASIASANWYWASYSFLSSVVYATVVYITDEDNGSVRTSTIYNELPSGVTPPATNAAGTQTAHIAIETARGKFTTVELAFPTRIGRSALAYYWDGVLPTYDAMSNFVCSTVSRPGVPVDLHDYIADLTTKTESITTDLKDPGGLYYTLQEVACPNGTPLVTPWIENRNDGAMLYCEKPTIACGATAMQSVKLLTETSNSSEKRNVAAPTANIAVTVQAPQLSTKATPTGALEPRPTTQEVQPRPTGQAPRTSPDIGQQSSPTAPMRPNSSSVLNEPVTPGTTVATSPSIGDAIASGVGEAGTANPGSISGPEQFQGGASSLPSSLWLVVLCLAVVLYVE